MSPMARNGFGALRRAVAGEVLEPGDGGYDAAGRPAVRRFHAVRPRAVVRCATVDDVARTLDFARRSGLPVVPRGGGHCFAGRSSTDGIALDLSPMAAVTVSPDGWATIGAGARLAGVYDALHEHGLTIPAGCGPTVGIAGLTLGGGLGLLGRRYGLTCDRLRAARVVLPGGRIVDCDAGREPELFWALRGAGGGQFGVVTSLVFDPVPSPTATRLVMTWAAAAASAVVAAWQRWAPGAPDGVNASLKIVAPGGGGPVRVVVFGALLGTGDADVAPLRDLAGTPPASEDHTPLPYPALKRSLAGLGEDPGDGLVTSRSEFFRRPLPDQAVAALLDNLTRDRVAGEHREVTFTPMGGAYNRVPPDATAFVHRGERFLLEHVTVHIGAPPPGAPWTHRSWAITHPWGSGRVYPNFPDPDLADWPEAYHGGNHARLVRAKRRYDPDNLLRFHQSL